MKSIHSALAVFIACLIAVTFSYAGEGHTHRSQIKLDVGGDDTLVADVSDLEIGESRQLWAGDKEVVVTNTEEGLKIEIDGETIDVGGNDHHVMEFHGEHGDSHQVFSSSHSKVIVKHLDGEADEHGFHFITADGEDVDIDFDLDGDHEWTDADGNHRIVKIGGGLGLGGEAAAMSLEASGVLDDLDEAKRQEILDALRNEGPHVEVAEKVIVIRKDHDEE